jgi:hypothetical protein
MFESADTSGLIHPEEFTVEDVLAVYKEFGYDMVFFDALVANGDRHAGNFGYLRDANTGEYLKPAPLFDFDHAFGSPLANDALIHDVADSVHMYPQRHKELVRRVFELELTDELLLKRLAALKELAD